MDVGGINARIKEFHEQNGGSANCVMLDDDWVIYANGAARERNPYGALMDPPADPLERAKRIVAYWQKKYDLALEEFDTFKNNHLGHAKTALKEKVVPAMLAEAEDVAAQLKQLKKKVTHCKKQLHAAEEELQKYKPARLRELEEMSERNRLAAKQMIEQLSRIKI